MKKRLSIIVLAIVTFFFALNNAFAKQMNINELGAEAKKLKPSTSYVYVIGYYAFTSTHKITQQDIMIASRSIIGDANDGYTDTSDLYKKMNIQMIELDVDTTTLEIKGWKNAKNLVGSQQLPEKDRFEIRYIDYKLYAEASVVNLNTDLTDSKYETYNNILDDKLQFKAEQFYDNKITISQNKISGLLLKKSVSDISYNTEDREKYAKAQYFFAFVLETPNATNRATINIKNYDGSSKPISLSDFDVKVGNSENKTPGIVILQAIDKESFDNSNKTISITLDNDGPEDVYAEETINYDLSGLIFQTTSLAEVSDVEDEISEDDLKILKDWGYTQLGNGKHFNLIATEGKTNEFKLTGKVELQSFAENTFDRNSVDGYFFVFNIKKPKTVESIPDTVKVTVKGEQTLTYGKDTFNSDGVFTEIFKLKDSCNNECKLTITVDWDGDNGKAFLPSEEMTIDYSGLVFEKSSKFEVKSINNVTEAENQLKTDFGWKKEEGFSVDFTTVGTTVNVTGILPILDTFENGKHPFEGDDVTGYYLPFMVEISETKHTTENFKTTVEFIHEGEESKTFNADNFDGDKVLYILRHLHKDADDKTFKITVDLDGAGEEYAPYTITFDWSELKLQEVSTSVPSLNQASEEDKIKFEGWNYKDSANKNLDLSLSSKNTYALTGTMTEQVLSPEVYGDDSKDGYYFTFTFVKPADAPSDKAKIASYYDAEATSIKKEFALSDYDASGNLTILKRFDKTTSCTTGDENCKLYYKVDWDGDGYGYLPTVYTIDYSEVTFEKASIFTVTGVNTNDQSNYVDGGFLKKDGYKVEVTSDKNHPNMYIVTGLLPIFEDEEWESNKNPFDQNSIVHYLGLHLKLDTSIKNENINDDVIKFLHGDEEDNTFLYNGKVDNLSSKNDLYILKYFSFSDTNKIFTITIDNDGVGEEYAPYTVTIDCTGLRLQDTSRGNFGNYDIIKEADLNENSQEKAELKKYGYDFETNEVEIKKELQDETGYESKAGLTGTVKEQTLKEGFKTNKGYFVPIKIEFPGKNDESLSDYASSWTLLLNTEDGNTKEYKPNDQEYQQGWVLVLFRIEENGKENSIKYQIDFDGDGYDFLPQEYVIEYDELTFAKAHEVKIEGVDNVDLTLWAGDIIDEEFLEKIPEPKVSEQSQDYREFAYWDNGEGNPILGTEVTDEMDTIKLVPHWNVYSDKFVEDVLKDLNSKLAADNNKLVIEEYVPNSGNIVISVIDPTTPVSKLGETNIPGTIAYILLKNEIKSVTLEVNEKTIEFAKDEDTDQDSLTSTIKARAKKLYNELLAVKFPGKDDTNVTISALANTEGLNSFSLTINPDDLPKNVSLLQTPGESSIALANVITAPTKYTFTYNSSVEAVKNETELRNALSRSASTIFIAEDFTVNNTIEINRSVTINSGAQNSKLTAAENVNSIFDVKSNNVIIENLDFERLNQYAIIVSETGVLTATNLTINPKNDAKDFRAGIEVKNGATLVASKLNFAAETYDKPAVIAEKGTASVTLTNTEETNAEKITKQKITPYEKYKEEHKDYAVFVDYVEDDGDYNYYNYYSNPKISKIYTTIITSHEAGRRIEVIRKNTYGTNINIPTLENLFTSFVYDGETYEFAGYSRSNGQTIYSGESSAPDWLIPKDKASVTADNHYWAVYKVTIIGGARKVSNEAEFKEALKDNGVSAIYITKAFEVTLNDEDDGTTDEQVAISRNLTIQSAPGQFATIKANQIKIVGKNTEVFFNRVKLEFTAAESQESLIEVEGKKLALWQTSIKNTGKPVKYAFNYKNNSSVVDIRWNDINTDGFAPNNITVAYIYVSGKLAAGTEVYMNTFKKVDEQGPKTVMLVNGFDDSATITEDDQTPDIRFESNTYRNMDYVLEINISASDNKADISFINKENEATIGMHYADEVKPNYGNIKLYDSNILKIKQKYINVSGEATDICPEGLISVQLEVETEMVMP